MVESWSLATLLCAALLLCAAAGADEPRVLQSRYLRLDFAEATGQLRAVHNKLTGETYRVEGDAFSIELGSRRVAQADTVLRSLERRGEAVTARYEARGVEAEVTYALGRDHHFAEKRIALTLAEDDALKTVVVSAPTFEGVEPVCYRYPQFGRPPGGEPICTFFGRSARGGLFAGLELPFDRSALDGRTVTLAYSPSLRIEGGRPFAGEPMYLGVYARGADDAIPLPPPIRFSPHDTGAPADLRTDPAGEAVPLRSESAAMVAMTSAILGPPRHGLVPMACGWHCEMQHGTYSSDEDVAADMRSLEFLAECGIDWVSDSHPWGGETEKMNALGPDDRYQPGPAVRRLAERAEELGIGVVMWLTMGNSHPWSGLGRPFRADRPEWLLTPGPAAKAVPIIAGARGNCLANRPFLEWLERINREGLATGLYRAWAVDGSFFGDGGWYTSIIPVDCTSDAHDHLPGDANYACQAALDRLIADVRAVAPDTFVFTCRPPMDLGVWSLRNVDADFTLLESGTGTSNLAAGDEIRRWSRMRVHHHFFPHYLDQPLLFPSRANRAAPPDWPSAHLDYILLSGLSSSPNQLYYLPTKTGIPDADKATLRRWLDWGRRNAEYLKVRRDLPDWPTPGRVDGSAHIVEDRGLVFLFNSGDAQRPGEFGLTEESIGLRGRGAYQITQEYPEPAETRRAEYGDAVQWDVPAQSALVLRIEPAG